MTSEYEFRLVNLRNRIERKAEVIFLGVIVDAKLTWSKHTATVKTKMSRYFGIMYEIRFRRSIPTDTKYTSPNILSIVQSHLTFC